MQVRYLSLVLFGREWEPDQLRGNEGSSSDHTASGTAEKAFHFIDPSLLHFGKLVARELRLRTELTAPLDDARLMILLEIYLAMSEARETPFMSAAHASNVPISTAQRYIHEMIDAGLIVQHPSSDDQRVRLVSLTASGMDLVTQILSRTMALRARID